MYRRLNILYAEDDLDDIELFREGLNGLETHHNLSVIRYGHEVLDRVRHEIPDLIFMDYNLPGCDGSECVQLLKADPKVRHIPIVMYSTSSPEFAVDRCFARGAARYLIKPVDYPALFLGLQYIFDLFKKSELTPIDRERFVIDFYKRKV